MISIGFLLALLVPAVYGFMNVVDKTIIYLKAKNIFSFAVLAGFVNFIFGALLAAFLPWENIQANYLFFLR